jgi:C4-type Zn-finger protein
MDDFTWLTNWVGNRPQARGTLNCPTCGRFAKVVSVQNDATPMTAEMELWVFNVNCRKCGYGQIS